ncbi:MAG: DUF2752 domain-containing protein [Flavobacterium sp.]|uniref:DUF2752 domain-containing protein n=1 Tax=Flavobacterium sp. TaxID=239 RepID=UPI00260B66B9|nr:DUF2752 domain-containing protein [Flavobacterium sp.]MDD5151647.1 DUF2752 domain-containing protein [Flavobacterium sp.]
MDLEKYMIPCLSKTLFGVECLGCGFQRALFLLLKGDFVAAFKMYPAIYVMLIFFIIVGLHFVDKQHNYKKPLKATAILTSLFMLIGYLYKHY